MLFNIVFGAITLAWLLELIIHRPDSKEKRSSSPAPVERTSLLLIWLSISLSIIVSAISSHFSLMKLYPSSEWLPFLGLLCYSLGVALRWWGIRVLGKHFSRFVKVAANHELVSHGPYRWLAHPLYLAILLSLTGISLSLNSVLGLLTVWAVFLPAILYRIKIEEHAMVAQFGQPYLTWRQQRWRIIPFLY